MKFNDYSLIDRATALFLASAGVLTFGCGIYQLIANHTLYWHIFAIGAIFTSLSGVTRKEAQK